MELLNKINEKIERMSKMEKKKERIYKPRKTTIEAIKTRHIHCFGQELTKMAVINRYQKYPDADHLFEIITAIKSSKIKSMNNETKQEIMDVLMERIQTETISIRAIETTLFGEMRLKKDRLRYLTKGENLDRYAWIEKEELEKMGEIIKK